MTPEPRTRARRRKPSIPVSDAAEPVAPVEESFIAGQQPESDPTIIDTTAIVISEEVQPLIIEPEPEPEPESARTDFFFPPPPRSRQQAESKAAGPNRRARRAASPRKSRQSGFRLLKGLARGLRLLVVFAARGFKRAIFPLFRAIWHLIVDDPYAPPRERPERAILQGRVLGVYRYRPYQRFILRLLGGIPLIIAVLYLIYLLVNGLLYGVDDRLFLAQGIAGAFAGLFSSLMMLSLASTRVTLRSDGIEYKTMFRVVRSRWEEISMLKVDYFRRSERWVVGTGRGAWAFLFRSLFGLPKGRQLAKLITIYARLSSTGTPYWLPSLGRREESRSPSRSASRSEKRPASRSTSRKAKAKAQQQTP
ncbi:MAG TPA: hypothetical protein VH599_16785 [Ktedonobacterales bacterium]|jgi:hypothetical protein